MFNFLKFKSKPAPPPSPSSDDFEHLSINEESSVPFGKPFREKYFGFDKDIVNLNHGSFGAIPTDILNAKVNHLKEIQSYPDPFFKIGIFDKIAPIRNEVADFIDADADNLVFVTNATTAINTVLRSYPLQSGDTIVVFSTIYGSCRNTIQYLQDKIGINVINLTLTYPMSHQEIIDTFVNIINDDNNKNIKMAFFDTVSSMPSAIIPWEKLCQICREHNILSVVDGAHGIGLVPLSLRNARPDFFTSNLHKWLFVPNSVALLYVDKAHHHYIHSLPISAVYLDDDKDLDGSKEKSRFADTFLYTGTIDYSSLLTVPDSIKFRNEICGGEEKINEYCFDLAQQASKLVAKEFGTEIMSGKEDNIITTMFNVVLPFEYSKSEALQGDIIDKYNRYIIKEWNTFVPIGYYNGQWWTRWSSQVYLDIEDFKYGIRAVLNSAEYLKTIYRS